MNRRACRDGKHAFGIPRAIGAGLTRSRCKYCRAIEIDLRSTEEIASAQDSPRDRFFRTGRKITIFDIEQAVSAGLYDVDEAG